MTIIGFSGRKRHGKDQAFRFLQDIFGEEAVVKLSFADPLKHEVAEHLKHLTFDQILLSLRQLPGFTEDVMVLITRELRSCPSLPLNKGMTYDELRAAFDDDTLKGYFRLILQTYGTEYRRNTCGEDYWTNAWVTTLKRIPETVKAVCACDVRFLNEVETVFANGGKVVRLIRDNIEDSLDTHPSETSLDSYTEFSYTLTHGSLAALEAGIWRIAIALGMSPEEYGTPPTNIYVDTTLTGQFGPPRRATIGSAAVDLVSMVNAIIPPGEIVKVPLNMRCQMPSGYCALMLSRSGLGSQGIRLANSVGLIDSDYTGQWFAAFINDSKETKSIAEGERCCQALFIKVADLPMLGTQIIEETERGSGGFGSTGRNVA